MIAHFNARPDPLCHLVRMVCVCVCVRMGASVNRSCVKLYSQDVEEDVEGELKRLNQMLKEQHQTFGKSAYL